MATNFSNVFNEDVKALKRRFRKPKHTKEHIKKESNRYFVDKSEAFSITKTIFNMSKIDNCERNSSPMILKVIKWYAREIGE